MCCLADLATKFARLVYASFSAVLDGSSVQLHEQPHYNSVARCGQALMRPAARHAEHRLIRSPARIRPS